VPYAVRVFTPTKRLDRKLRRSVSLAVLSCQLESQTQLQHRAEAMSVLQRGLVAKKKAP
jgi:hypothetical protein